LPSTQLCILGAYLGGPHCGIATILLRLLLISKSQKAELLELR